MDHISRRQHINAFRFQNVKQMNISALKMKNVLLFPPVMALITYKNLPNHANQFLNVKKNNASIYIFAFYWIFEVITTVGYGDYSGKT